MAVAPVDIEVVSDKRANHHLDGQIKHHIHSYILWSRQITVGHAISMSTSIY
jgi:hypothetical protein